MQMITLLIKICIHLMISPIWNRSKYKYVTYVHACMLYMFFNIHLNNIEIQAWRLTHSNVPHSGSMVDLNCPFVRKAPRPFQNLGQTLHYCYF